MTIPLDRLATGDFETLLQRTLPVRCGDRAFELVLERVTPSPFASARPVPGFSLVLRGSRETEFAQGMIALDHPVHGTLEIFVTPIGRDAGGVRYEAVFN